MDAAIAPRALYRSPETLAVAVDDQRQLVDFLLTFANAYVDVDMRPLLVSPDGMVERLGPDPVPQDLREKIADEARTLAELRYEYARARLAEYH